MRGSEKFSQMIKEATHDKAYDEESDYDKLVFIIKRFKYRARKKNKFSGKKYSFKGQVLEVKIRMVVTTVRGLGISLMNVLTFKKTKARIRASRRTTSEASSRKFLWKHGKNLTMKENMKNPILL